jgi:multisubunit Na+/H+ antiporter MnhE subunit
MSVSVPIVVAIALVWCAVLGEFNVRQLLLGSAFGLLYVLLTGAGREQRISIRSVGRRALFAFLYLFVLLPVEVTRANLGLARRLRATPEIRPGIVRVPLGEDVARATVALEEHTITLTPGQLLVDYSAEENTAYLHVVDVGAVEALRRTTWRRYRRYLDRIFT